jgi:hypothetical protein
MCFYRYMSNVMAQWASVKETSFYSRNLIKRCQQKYHVRKTFNHLICRMVKLREHSLNPSICNCTKNTR